MYLKILVLSAALTMLLAAPASATVSIEAAAADLQDSSGNLMPISGVAVLVADTGTNGFTNPQASFSLTVGATWGSDDKVIGLWDLSGLGTDGFLDDFTTVTYTGGVAQGQKLQLYWFPSLTLASSTVGATYYGKYTDTNNPALDGSDLWVLPSNGSSISLWFLTASEGGSNPDSAGRATLLTAQILTSSGTNSWSSATDGKWETGVNWSTGSAPASGDFADFITNANTKTVSIDVTTTAVFPFTMIISNLTVTAPSGSTNSLVLNNSGTAVPLQVLSNFTADGNASIVVSNGALVATNAGVAFSIGNTGAGNQMTILAGGKVQSSFSHVGFTNTSSGNLVLVAGAGSVWTNQSFLHVGHNSWNNWLVISNGGAVYDLDGVVGFAPTSSNNTALVTGVGSVWNSQTFLDVGEGGSSNLLNIAGGSVMSTDVVVGFNAFATNNVLLVSGGSLVVTNSLGKGSLVISRIGGKGSLILNSGSVTADALVATNGANSVVTFNGGTLNSGSTFVTNGQVFAVGDGTHAARFTLLGGMHSFANNLEIRTNAVLSGCGTIDGNVLVDTSGFLFASCGSALNFSGGTLTNNGTITAINGTAVNFFGPVVNNGLIDNTSGNVRFFSTLSGSGSMLTPSTNSWIGGNGKWETATNWSAAQPPSLTDGADFIANAGNKTVTIDATTSGGFPNSLTISNLTVAAPLNSTNTLLLSNAGTNTPLAVRNTFSIGSRGSVFITNSALKVAGPTGGSVTVDGQLTLVDDGTILVSSNLLVGPVNPLGTVNILGGALYVTNAAHNAVTEVRYGTIMLTNAVFATDSLLITNPGASFLNNGGTFTITGLSQVDQGTQTVASGTTQISSNLLIGSAADSTGTVNVAGGQLIATNASITVGSLGVGNMTVSNASVSTIALAVGAGTNSQGTLTLQDGSDVTISSNLTAGSASGATGIVNITGGSLTVTNGTLGVGNDGTVSSGSGTGFMTVSNATVTASTILLGSSAGGQGEMTLDDGGVIQGSGTNAVLICNGFGQIGGDLSWTNFGSAIYCGYTHPGVFALSNGTASCQDMYVGYDNTGTMTVAGGFMNILSRLIVGQLSSPLSSGAVWITGGQLTIASFSIIGNSGIGQMTISNGTVTMTDVFVGNGSNPGTLTLVGGALTANGIVVANPNSRFNFIGGRLSARAITNANGRAVTLGDGISPATFNLLGGASSLDNGLTVAAASTLSGLGTVSGTVVNFGFIFPLSGALTISGVVTNHGTIAPTAGNTINFNGQVFNDGFIFTNRATHFNGGLINSGTLVDADADPDHDGFTNLEEYEAGTDPNDPKSTPFQITSIVQQGNDVLLTWLTAGGKTNVVQATGNAPSNYSNNFTDLSPVIVPQGSDLTYTNYLDLGATTNFPARYYRVRLVP